MQIRVTNNVFPAADLAVFSGTILGFAYAHCTNPQCGNIGGNQPSAGQKIWRSYGLEESYS